MKKFITIINRIKDKVNAADLEFRCSFDKSDIRCNPFVSNPTKTFVWAEKLKEKID